MTKNSKKSIIRVGILGYGNLGRGVELAIQQNADMELVGIFTRRDPKTIQPMTKGAEVFPIEQALLMTDDVDVMVLCGGSAVDLAVQSPEYVRYFNIVDSFDTHAKVPEHFAAVDEVAQKSGKLAVLSVGWDPGLFSLNRLYAETILPAGETYTFWGTGVSQGHSDAVRRIPGVANAIQYTIPVEEAMERVRSGACPTLTAREKHTRLCYVVAEEQADKEKIRQEIVHMPDYFADYDTTVKFITAEEMTKEHSKMAHGGFVLRSGTTGAEKENHQLYEFALKLDSNPQFTGSVLVSYARAVARLAAEGATGARTAFDIAPAYLSAKSGETLRSELL